MKITSITGMKAFNLDSFSKINQVADNFNLTVEINLIQTISLVEDLLILLIHEHPDRAKGLLNSMIAFYEAKETKKRGN